MRTFYRILTNTLVASVTTSFLWFALVFWLYLETKSVLTTGILGGIYMALVAATGVLFGAFVDAHAKKRIITLSTVVTLVTFVCAGVLYALIPQENLLQVTSPWLWVFSVIILIGCIAASLRGIVMSTLVTLLVPKERRANANGIVGTVSGVGFIVTSVFSGLAIGFLGMGWTLVITIGLMVVVLVDVLMVRIPEEVVTEESKDAAHKKIDIKGSVAAIRAVPGLFALLLFSTFNNLVGGVYMALLDPYGLTLFSVEMWGIIFGIAGTGFVIGGAIIAKWGLGKNPVKTLLWAVIFMGLIGGLFTIREVWWLFVVGIWLYMIIMPVIEAAEQTVIQQTVPYKRQGRVFGFAQAFESAAAPITAFMIAPIAEWIIIPFANSPGGRDSLGWLLGEGEARGIALVFLISGIAIMVAAGLAFLTRSYRTLSTTYARVAASPEAK